MKKVLIATTALVMSFFVGNVAAADLDVYGSVNYYVQQRR